jgi:hypothetical protein
MGMPRRGRPQVRFLARGSLLLAGMLALWWLALRGPLLDWVQFSAEILLQSIPGVRAATGVTIGAGGVWELQVPVPADSETIRRLGPEARFRSVRIQVADWIPTLDTAGLPLYWAIWLAAPWSRRWGGLLTGTGILLAVAPFSLLSYTAHVVQVNLYPQAPAALAAAIAFADHLTGTVVPFLLPVVLALGLHRGLRAMILFGEPEPDPSAHPGHQAKRRTAKPIRQ